MDSRGKVKACGFAAACREVTTSASKRDARRPGMKPPLKALTVVPFGMEEGSGHQIQRAGVRAEHRRTRAVPAVSIDRRKQDAPGEMLEDIGPNGR